MTTLQEPTLIYRRQIFLGTTSVILYELGKELKLAEMFCPIVKVGEGTLFGEIERLLREGNHTFAEAQLDEMLKKQNNFLLEQEDGEDFGLRSDGAGNLVPVEKDGSVYVVYLIYSAGEWIRQSYLLTCDFSFPPGRCLVVIDMDPSDP